MKSKLPIVSLIAVTATLLIGILVLTSWFLHQNSLLSIIPGQVKMQFNTALCFILSSIVILLSGAKKTKTIQRFSWLLSAIIFILSLSTIVEYIFGISIGIDEMFMKDDIPTTTVYFAGRMSPLTSINFIFISVGLQLLNKQKTATYQFVYLSAVVFISLLMLISFNFISDVSTYFRLAILTVLGFIILCIAIWYAQPMLKQSISFERKLYTGFATVLVLIAVLSLFSFYYNNKRNSTALLVNHTNLVIDETQQILSATKDFESGSRGYIITGDSAYLEYFSISKKNIVDNIQKLKDLTSDNPLQQSRTDSLELYIKDRIDFSQQTVDIRNNKDRQAAMDLVASGKGLFYTSRIRNIIYDIQDEEIKILVQRQLENNKSITSFNRAFLVLLVSLFILLIIIVVSIRNNINRRKKNEKELQEFKYFFNNSNDLSCIANHLGYFEIVNPSFIRLLGYTQNELSKIPFIDFVHPQDVASTMQIYAELKTGAPVIHFSNRYRKSDGNYLLLDWNATPNPATGKLYCIARDITERKKAEDALTALNNELEQKVIERTKAFRQSEKQYRLLFQNNPMPMWVIDLTDFKFLDVNEMAILQYGYSREEFLSMSAVDIRPTEDRETFLKADHTFTDSEPNYNKGIWRHRKKDGSIILVDIIGHKILFEGIPARLILANDVTAKEFAKEKLVNNEKRFRALVENNYDMISMLDESFKVIYSSPSVKRIMGIDPLGKNIEGMDNAHPDDRAYAQEILKQASKNPGEPVNGIFRRRHADGHYIWLEGIVTNLLHDKDVQAYITNFHDISERKKLEDLLHKTNTLARIGSWEVDLEKETVYWSNITREIHETEPDYTPTLETGFNFYKSGKRKDLIIQKVQQAIETGKPWDEELQIITAKNNERWIRTIGQTEFVNGKCVKIYGSFQDIDQRKKVEEEIKDSEEKRRLIMSGALDAIICIDTKGTITFWNPHAQEIFGWKETEVMGKDLSELIIPEPFRKYHNEGIKHYLKTGEGKALNVLLELSAIRQSGEEFPIELTVIPIKQGEDEFFCAFIRDITQRKRAEQETTSLQATLETSLNEIYVFDAETMLFSYVNKGALLNLGYSLAEIKALTPIDIKPDFTATSFNLLVKPLVNNKKEKIIFFTNHKRKNGSLYPVEVHLQLVAEGNHKRFLAIILDITERKKAEEKVAKSERIYKTIASSIPGSAILLVDINYRYLLIEGDMLEKFGYSREQLLGKTVKEVLQPNRYQELLPHFKRVFGGDTFTTESDIDKFHLNTRYVPLRDESGNVYAAMIVVIDITELKKAESNLVELNAALEEKVITRTEQLKRTNEELEAFSYSVSHDLRAPLRGIIGFTNILEEDYSNQLDDEAKRITAVIKNNTLKMGNLIDDLLRFSQLGRQQVVKTNVHTAELVEEVIAELGLKNNGKVNLIIPALPDAQADRNTIKQVWINLISNAVKYSHKQKEPVVEIGIIPADNEITFFVKDNGVGFDEKYSNKLFKVFQRLHSGADFEGTGVGLAIVERIITKHDGRVWAEAAPGKGACFYFTLPIKQEGQFF